MELQALRSGGGGTFNPFTSLIGFDATGDTRRLYLAVPVIEEHDYSRYSVLYHELAHLWSMRTTLLGAILSVAAAPAMAKWRKNPAGQVHIPEEAFSLLGAWLPVLEGLATYAELDFVGDEDTEPIHSPILKVVQFTAPRLFDQVTSEQHFELIHKFRNIRDRLLALTLLDRPNSPNEHSYLTGYLYVKALASRFVNLCPRLAPPSRMLPLLIRVLCDHPAVLDWRHASFNARETLARVHSSALALSPALLNQIADWVEKADPGEVVSRFDFLNIDESLRQSNLQFHEPSSEWYDGLSDEAVEELSRLRHAASFYLAAWRSGTLLSASEKSFVLQEGTEQAEYVLLTAASFEPIARPILERLVALLQQAVGTQLTAALYIDTASGDPGMAFWKEDQFLFASPYSVSFAKKSKKEQTNFVENLEYSLALAPMVRRRFAEAIDTPQVFTSAATDASLFLLEQMISSKRVQNRILQSKLAGVENGGFLSDWHAWCAPPSFFSNTPLPTSLLQAYDRIFDFPGFFTTTGLRFANLLPKFEVHL